jgi:hypothetical protein
MNEELTMYLGKEKQVRTSERSIRNAGYSSQYYTLRLVINGKEIQTHTSKNLNYIMDLERQFFNRG